MKKVALVGGSPSWESAPFHDTDWSIWVHGNQLDRFQGKPVHRIFEIHDDLREHPQNYAHWLVDHEIPLVVGEKFPLSAPHVEVFPYEQANRFMGQHLTSTPAYMMAYALIKEVTTIAIFGVDMAVDDHEYFYQRPAMYAWIAYALAKGVKVSVEGSLFTDAYVEGESWGKPDIGLPPFTTQQFETIAAQHEEAMKHCDSQIHALTLKRAAHDGSRQSYERLAKVSRAIESGVTVKNLTDSMVLR